jgi:hypothetical protein
MCEGKGVNVELFIDMFYPRQCGDFGDGTELVADVHEM